MSAASFIIFKKKSKWLPLTIEFLNTIGIPNSNAVYYPGTPQEITGIQIWEAVNRYEGTMKSLGILNNMKAIYLFIGGTAITHKYNFLNPLDTDAAYRAIFNGGIVHSETGIQLNQINGWMDTNLAPNLSLNQNNTHASIYNRTNVVQPNAYDLDSTNITGTNSVEIIINYGGLKFYAVNNPEVSFANVLPLRGMYTISRIISTQIKMYRNTLNTGTSNTNSLSPLPPRNINIGRFSGGGAYSGKEYSYASIGDGLTDLQVSQHYNAVQALQTALHRQI